MLQVNIGSSGIVSNLELVLAFEKKIDLVLIQKPWIKKDLDGKLFKKYNAY